ncbi:MAG TPA: sigma-54 dependent transcriptional regulator [Candidatus Acidoferrales bacterium]|nr:sigma-54 dependent transcriptional regulator [Candidatus Acidoferrales bacterium]
MAGSVYALIVDDEKNVTDLLQVQLEEEGFTVDTANDGAVGINKIQAKPYDVILLDLKMPRINGIEVLKFAKENQPDSQVLILTGYGDIKTAVDTIKMGAFDFITKPYNFDELLVSIKNALDMRRLLVDNKVMKMEIGEGKFEIVGESLALKKVIEIALKVASSDASVLITGPSGSGKELIAHLIHENSERAKKPFVAVNCASIPDTLIESELFGHEKGAFTDAHSLKQGLTEIANGGTLFLDEVGDISYLVQPKLLRFIETGTFRRVGGTIEMSVDARIISATNKDLDREVDEQKFREDLLFRLNVVHIEVPPLGQRREDIPILVDHFLQKKHKARRIKRISDAALKLLMGYDWPGNIRELENVIERAAILAPKDEITPEYIALSSKSKSADLRRIPTRLSIAELEKIHIENVLKANGYNRTKSAQALGISLKTLYLKIKSYEIDTPAPRV